MSRLVWLHSLSGLHLSRILSTTFAEIVIVGVARSIATQQSQQILVVMLVEQLRSDP